MRWAGRAISSTAATFLVVMLIGSLISEVLGEGGEPPTLEGVALGILGVVAFAGAVLSWWRERLASMLLLTVGVGLGIHIGICAERNHVAVWIIIGLPYLVAALLLLASWWLSKKTA